MQVLDVRDLARLVVLLLERDLPGAFNAAGPTPSVSFRELVETCGDVSWYRYRTESSTSPCSSRTRRGT